MRPEGKRQKDKRAEMEEWSGQEERKTNIRCADQSLEPKRNGKKSGWVKIRQKKTSTNRGKGFKKGTEPDRTSIEVRLKPNPYELRPR